MKYILTILAVSLAKGNAFVSWDRTPTSNRVAFATTPSSQYNRQRRRRSANQLYMDDQSGGPATTNIQVDKSKLGNVSARNLPPSTLPNGGKVSMVGSGPGDPDLLTVAAYKLLSDPDLLVVTDRLVSPEILELVKGEIKVARKHPGCAEEAQNEIYRWCKEGIDAGKHVVRLKIGDPFVFGRGGEEVLKFREFGIEPTVIPGVSAAFSAPLLGSIPVTHRGVANQVVMCTGYGRNGTSPDLIQYHKEQTIVFLMAVGRLRELCQRLIDLAGYPSKTPVAIIQDAGCPSQRTVAGTMETIADLAEEYKVKAPSTIVVGEVVRVLLADDKESSEELHGLIHNMTATNVF